MYTRGIIRDSRRAARGLGESDPEYYDAPLEDAGSWSESIGRVILFGALGLVALDAVWPEPCPPLPSRRRRPRRR
jgi:hypothetical protein